MEKSIAPFRHLWMLLESDGVVHGACQHDQKSLNL